MRVHAVLEQKTYTTIAHVLSYVLFCSPKDCCPPSSSVQGIFSVRVLEWTAISSSRGSSQPRDRTCVSCISCIVRLILYHWATWEPTMLMDFQGTCHIVGTFKNIVAISFMKYVWLYLLYWNLHKKIALITTTSFWRLILVFIYFISNPHIQ